MTRYRSILLAGAFVAGACAWLWISADVAARHPTAAKGTRAEHPPLFDNLGSHHHEIATNSPEAQKYFDQGLRLMYGFNHAEAIRAFREAAHFDPNCAMAQWGIALALGPNYNIEAEPERTKLAYETVQQALKLAANANERDRAYVEALSKRYVADPNAPRPPLDRAFADAMKQVVEKHPEDLDAAVLYAEAMMDLRPWELWTKEGQPQPGTEEIVATLERVLKANPDHPGANHLYIHAIEASTTPERGLPAAQRLGGLMPGAGHMVHMPSHIYLRLGMYKDAVDCNRRAAEVDRAYIAAEKPAGPYPMLYYPHNVHFEWCALCFEGREAEALAAGSSFAAMVTPAMVRAMPMIAGFFPTHLYTLVRFGKWDEILKQPSPPADLSFSVGNWHFARGRALAAQGKLDEASKELDALAAILVATPPDKLLMRHRADHLLNVAYYLLNGDIALRQGKLDRAIVHLKQAVRLQDQLSYDEPPAWFYPTRQSLGAALLAAKRPAEAAVAYQEDLKQYPDNGWSLFGLAESLRMRGKTEEAATAEKRFRKAWERSDIKLNASAF
jgi:tetratricopeptide (TPR) repeat protein